MDQEIIDEINSMSHADLARLWRFEPSGSIYFKEPYYEVFRQRFFFHFDGMTSAISKEIGWD
jgi:hypothetical protein